MNQATISIRVEPSLKQKFDKLCDAFGLSTTAAFNIFMKAVVRERRIPFEIRAEHSTEVQKKAIKALRSMQRFVAKSDMPEMDLDEINAEIKAIRDERRIKSSRGN